MDSDIQTSKLLLFFGIAILIMVALALIVVLYSNHAQKRILEQQMNTQELQLQHQQELLQRNLIVQEEERQRIAAQLHDDIGSKLGVLHLTFHRLRRTEAQNDDYAPLCEEINVLIANTLETTRRISHELLPPTLEDFGLIEALLEFCDGVRKTGSVEINFNYNIGREDLTDSTLELNLFRIVQELTTNTLKYANAKEINILLTKEEDKISLQYTDDGMGFDLENTRSKGLGLKNIEHRVAIIGGLLQVNSTHGNGFQLRVTC